jgi:hypothetical protein
MTRRNKSHYRLDLRVANENCLMSWQLPWEFWYPSRATRHDFARLDNRELDVHRLYVEAVRLAREHGFIQNETIFYRERDELDRFAIALAVGRFRREAHRHVRSAAGRFLRRPATSSLGTAAHASSAIWQSTSAAISLPRFCAIHSPAPLMKPAATLVASPSPKSDAATRMCTSAAIRPSRRASWELFITPPYQSRAEWPKSMLAIVSKELIWSRTIAPIGLGYRRLCSGWLSSV